MYVNTLYPVTLCELSWHYDYDYLVIMDVNLEAHGFRVQTPSKLNPYLIQKH